MLNGSFERDSVEGPGWGRSRGGLVRLEGPREPLWASRGLVSGPGTTGTADTVGVGLIDRLS